MPFVGQMQIERGQTAILCNQLPSRVATQTDDFAGEKTRYHHYLCQNSVRQTSKQL